MNTQKLEPVPGPWMAVGKVVKSDWGRDSVTVTRVDSRGKFVEGYDEANARLIAAAPEMLAALKGAQSALRKAMPFIKDPDETSNIGAQLYCREWLDEINEVIAKAKGGTE